MSIEQQVEDIDTAIDALDVMIQALPLKSAVRHQLTAHLYTMFTQLEEAMDLISADFD